MAENNLTVYGAVPNAMEFINSMGTSISQSGMFGEINCPMGVVLAMTCLAKNCDPMTLAQRYHVISGKLSMRSDAMIAEFRNRGGRHRVIDRTSEIATIELTLDGDTQEYSLSWEEAKKEPFVYNAKEKEALRMIETGNEDVLRAHLKPKYATPRARMQMLWSRVVSDGIRAMCPEVNLGSYTPEEISDMPETARAETSTAAIVGPAAPLVSSPGLNASEQIEDATFTPVDPDAGKITGKQLTRISELFKALDMSPEKQLASAKKRGADSVATLSIEQADNLLAALDAAYQTSMSQQVGNSVADGESMSEPIDSQISQQSIDKIKSLIGQLVQMPGNADIVERMQAKLAKHGIAKFGDLTEPSGQRVINTLAVKNIDAFFALDLEQAKKNG